MRIRRLSSRILGTSAVPPPSPPPPAALLPSAAGQLQAALVCVLNQSPWDVLPCPPSPPLHSKLPPFNQKAEAEEDENDEGMHDANGTGSDEESKTPPIILSLPATNSEMYDEVTKKSKPVPVGVKKKKMMSQKKQGKGGIRVKEEISGGGISATCNKTDGKQWKCKQPVSHPHSLCSYHRSQLRSYAKPGGGNPKKAVRRKKASGRASAAAGSDSNSFYYYSNFGPWRGKRRGGENGKAAANTEAAVEEADEEMKSDDNAESGTNEASGEVHAEDDDDNVDKDSDGETRGSQMMRRRRKPVKARSLKSLL